MIERQAQQIGPDTVVMVGDSISEMMWLPQLCGRPVLNAAIGGTGIDSALQVVRTVSKHARPAAYIVATGVNDASRSAAFDPAEWRSKLKALIASAGNATVTIVEPLPVEAGKPLGTPYFDPARLAQMRDIVRSTASSVVRAPLRIGTTDGVHPVPASLAAQARALTSSCEAKLQRK